MTESRPIRLCIIEDHAIVRAGLKLLLAAEPDLQVVGEAVDRKSALEIAKRECPDLFLVDIQLASGSAVDFLEELLTTCQAKAVLLTGITAEDQIERAVLAGATGLVAKTEAPEVLICAIRKVQSGEAWLSRSLATSALSRLRTLSSSRTAHNPESAKIATLTAREREIVALVGRGLNRRRIADTLFVSEATVRNHLTSIFSKLEVSRQFELVFYAQRYGLDKPSAPAELFASNSM